MHRSFRFLVPLALAAALLLSGVTSAAAFFFGKAAVPSIADFSKSTPVGEALTFSAQDFQPAAPGKTALKTIELCSLPDSGAGTLQLGSASLSVGSIIESDRLPDLVFYPALSAAEGTETAFSFLPTFTAGAAAAPVTVTLRILAAPNSPPVAENLSLTTYRDASVSGRLAAVDPEGDAVTFLLAAKPARGSVTIEEDGSFLYTPYEGKTGKDSFTYWAEDAVGNRSQSATVRIVIEKPTTKVRYEDLSGDPAGKAAVKLAETGVFVGETIGGRYCFSPQAEVSRSEFLSMAMEAAGTAVPADITVTGFSDDSAIASWAKPYVATALQCGYIQGVPDSTGSVVFAPDAPITAAEASVLLDRVLNVTDLAAETAAWTGDAAPAWAAQAVANLSSTGVMTASLSSSAPLTRGEAAQILCGAMELLEDRGR